MPSAGEVLNLEGVSAAQHRFRISVNDENGGSSNPPRPPPEGGTPFFHPHRNSRYKEKFQALREKYDRVTAKQQEYHQDLEIATEKIKKLQAENDLLLDAMNLAASHQPSMFGLLPPAHPPDAPRGGGPMNIDAGPVPPRHHVNGNGVSNGTRSGSSSSGHGHLSNGNGHPPLPEAPSAPVAPTFHRVYRARHERARAMTPLAPALNPAYLSDLT
ncbi:hypothetical protein DFH06DRAFT_1333588 [Mycena polygramma]|nr:hypothetical protein DFH06DRAFT_1333588 [Mycena polygramma]